MLFLLTEKPASLLVLKHENETGTTGDGQKALQELVSNYNKVTDEVIRAKMDKLVNTNMEQGEDPDSYLMEKTLARSELEKMGEIISDRRFKDICVQGFTAEYKDIKMMMYRDPTFDIDQMQSTMRHLYLDDISRNSDTTIAGRGVAMTLASTCSQCGKQGYYARNCWKRNDDNDRKSTGAYNKQKNKESSKGKAASNVGAEHKLVFCTQNCLARRHGMLQARSTTPTAEWTRSHCLCCTRRGHTPQPRRKAVSQLRRWFRRGICVYRAASW